MQTQARNHYNVTQTTKDLHRTLNVGATAIHVIVVAPKKSQFAYLQIPKSMPD